MKALEKRFIPKMNEHVTFVGFGALEIGRDWGLGTEETLLRPEDGEAEEVLQTVLDVGINLIDTASAYHRSEERIGRFLHDRRQEYLLASKCGEHSREPNTYYDYSYAGIAGSIDRSLSLLRTDVIDIMQIHFGPEPEEVLARGETVGAMKDARQAGKVRFLGASIDGAMASRCIESGEFDVMQMSYNLLHQENGANIERAANLGMGVFIRTGLGNGLLTSRVMPMLGTVEDGPTIRLLLELVDNDPSALSSLALRFLYANPHISSVLLGTKKAEHVKDNLQLLERPFGDEGVLPQAIAIVDARDSYTARAD